MKQFNKTAFLWLPVAFYAMILNFCFLASTTNILAQEKTQPGWKGEKMPSGMRKGDRQGEYIWEKDGTIMIYIPAGKFIMGRDWAPNEKPVHIVNLSAFYIDKFEISRGVFRKFVESTKYKTTTERLRNGLILRPQGIEKAGGKFWDDPGFPQNDSHPVVLVSWEDAKAYVKWSGKKLPTEAQWEKSASWDESAVEGKKKKAYPWGNSPAAGRDSGTANPKKLGNFADISFAALVPEGVSLGEYLLDPNFGGQYNDGYVYTSPVGEFPLGKSAYGLYNMMGNVWEWCEDGYTENFYERSPADNPVNTDGYAGHVIRGTGYDIPCTNPQQITFRTFVPANESITTIGFRTVVNAPLQ